MKKSSQQLEINFSRQQDQKDQFFSKLGSMIGLDLEKNSVDKIVFDRIRGLESNPKIVLFDSRINGLDQRGIITEESKMEMIKKYNL